MSQPAPEPKPPAFEEALLELEAIVRDLETGETSLEQSLARYEQGVGLLKSCYAQLQQAEQKVLLLTGEDGSGKPTTLPFEGLAPLDTERAAPKRRTPKDDTSY